jgi:hypothetical protein
MLISKLAPSSNLTPCDVTTAFRNFSEPEGSLLVSLYAQQVGTDEHDLGIIGKLVSLILGCTLHTAQIQTTRRSSTTSKSRHSGCTSTHRSEIWSISRSPSCQTTQWTRSRAWQLRSTLSWCSFRSSSRTSSSSWHTWSASARLLSKSLRP